MAGSGERAAITLTSVAGFAAPPGEDNDAQLFAQHTRPGSNRWTASKSPLTSSTSPRPDRGDLTIEPFSQGFASQRPKRT